MIPQDEREKSNYLDCGISSSPKGQKKNNKMNKRVVITGLGVVAPNGVGLDAFTHAIKNGISGIKHDTELERLQFSCQIAGKPEISAELAL